MRQPLLVPGMNDNVIAYEQLLKNMSPGNELALEYRGVVIRLIVSDDIFIGMIETMIVMDSLYYLLLNRQNELAENEYFVIYENNIFYCFEMKGYDLSSLNRGIDSFYKFYDIYR